MSHSFILTKHDRWCFNSPWILPCNIIARNVETVRISYLSTLAWSRARRNIKITWSQISIKRNMTALFGVILWKLLFTYTLHASLTYEHKPWNVCFRKRRNLCESNGNHKGTKWKPGYEPNWYAGPLPFYFLLALFSWSLCGKYLPIYSCHKSAV